MKRKTETVAATEIASAEIVDAAVGARIRALRRSNGLGLNEMSARTGLSIGFLSQMERGLSSPTLRALTSLADAMQINLAEVVRGPTVAQPKVPVITRAGERSSISMWKSGIRKHALASGGAASSAFSFTLLDFEPHASSGDDLYTHQGEEAGYVLQGRLKLVVGDKQWTLAAGDSFHFSSELPHRFENAANRNLVVVMVNART
jgi:transcriptional regulator with XRE-family HTH domain